MDYWELARAAIEQIVAAHHHASSDNWSAIVPMDVEKGWGLDLARWSVEARTIIDSFEHRIERELSVPNAAVIAAGNKAVDEFQAYLVAKAQITGARIAYYQTKAVLATWDE